MRNLTHRELLESIEGMLFVFNTVIESDCIGDMMAYMDRYNIRYTLVDGDTDEHNNRRVREKYIHAVADNINRLHTQAQTQAQREIYSRY